MRRLRQRRYEGFHTCYQALSGPRPTEGRAFLQLALSVRDNSTADTKSMSQLICRSPNSVCHSSYSWRVGHARCKAAGARLKHSAAAVKLKYRGQGNCTADSQYACFAELLAAALYM